MALQCLLEAPSVHIRTFYSQADGEHVRYSLPFSPARFLPEQHETMQLSDLSKFIASNCSDTEKFIVIVFCLVSNLRDEPRAVR